MSAKLPKMTPVVSSNINAIGYDAINKIMYIEYKSGLYQFTDIGPTFYKGLMDAPSKGKYINASGKKGTKVV